MVIGMIPSRVHRASGEPSAGVWSLAGQESLAKEVCCCPVSLGGCLGVDGQGESWVSVSEARLGCFDIDAFEDETGGVGPAEVVELEPFEAGSLSCWIPDPI